MGLKETFTALRGLLHEIAENLSKAEAGNKTAAQRARKLTIAFEKTAKMFRKESVKKGAIKKEPKAAKKKTASKGKKSAGKSKAKRATKGKRKVVARKKGAVRRKSGSSKKRVAARVKRKKK